MVGSCWQNCWAENSISHWLEVELLKYLSCAPVRYLKNVISGDACICSCSYWGMCTECGLKVSMLMPAFYSIVFSHLVMVDELTGWYGLIVAINSFEICFLKVSVCFSYAQSVSIGHKLTLWGKAGKKKSAIPLSCFVCLANFVGANNTPSGRYHLNLKSRPARSADLDGLVRAKSMITL